MATTYTAKLDVSCVKQHKCLGCEAEYEYTLQRNVTGSGGTEAAAAANAEKAALKALEDDVDQHACPYCGLMQPDMISEVRSTRYVAGMWLGPLVLLVAFFLALPQIIAISTSAMIAAGGVALSLLLYLSGIFFNPNRDMGTQQLASSDKVQAGTLKLNQEGKTSTSVDEHGGPGGGHWLGLLLALTALVAVLAPLVLPAVSGWPMNDSYPSVVGPGDTTCIYFDQKIQSLKGYWRGNVLIVVQNEGDFDQLPQLRGDTKQSIWGDTISGKSVRNESNAMWAEVTLPDDPALAGKTLELRLEVQATYPLELNGGFDDLTDRFIHQEILQLSGVNSGTLYWQSWIFGQLGSIVLLIAAGSVLCAKARALKAVANPPAIQVAEEDDTSADADFDDTEESDEEPYDDDPYDDVPER